MPSARSGEAAMPERFDVLVIGAGIVGAACVMQLHAAGLAVGVVDPGPTGGGATGAGMGHIVVMDGSPPELALTRYSRDLWAQRGTAADRLWCGTIWVAGDDLDEARRKHRAHTQQGVMCELVDEPGLRALEPALRPGLAGGLLVPGDGVVYPPTEAAALLAGAGPVIRAAVAGLVPGGVTLADGRRLWAGATVLAAGLGCAALLPELPLRPKKGHLAITDRYPGFIGHQLVELGYARSAHASGAETVAFNVQPRPTGQVLVGSSRQVGCASGEVEHPLLARMLQRACAYLPRLAELDCIRAWTGVRVATPDGLPLIGPHPTRPGLWIAAGHEGLGITTALATGRLLADQLLGRPPDIPPAPYLPARFPEVAAGA